MKIAEKDLIKDDISLISSIEEEINASYLTAKVDSKVKITFYKKNKKIQQKDFILNGWLIRLNEDFIKLISSCKEEELKLIIGSSIEFFFIPNRSGIYSEYEGNYAYIIRRIKNHMNEEIFSQDIHNNIIENLFNNELFICYHYLDLKKITYTSIYYFDDLKKIYKSECLNKNPYGFIIRNRNNIYKIKNPESQRFSDFMSEVPLEGVLSEFLKTFTYEDLEELSKNFSSNYVMNVCIIFINFIQKRKDDPHFLKGISPEDLNPPYIGEIPPIGLSMIPSPMVKQLCKESLMYENIFKILLNSLSKKKRRFLFLNDEKLDLFNKMIRLIESFNEKTSINI